MTVGDSYNQNWHLHVWRKVRGPFLFPPGFPGHVCDWERFSFTQAGCRCCGNEHRCPSSTCVLERDDDGHLTCTITAFVVRDSELRPEWAAAARTHVAPEDAAASAHTQSAALAQQQLQTPCNTWAFVNHVVSEILHSETTQKCRRLESEKLCTVQTALLQKSIKRQRTRRHGVVNLLHAAADVAWASRKTRRPVTLPDEQVEQLIAACTDSITKIILQFHGAQMVKIKSSDNKRREFACSMLYLMRNGVDARGVCVLPKLEIMAAILPPESFLQEHFHIRSKSITEGENLLKLEMQALHRRQQHTTTSVSPL